MSNQDEDEVEDELEAMEREVARTTLPDAPKKNAIGDGALPDAPVTELDWEQERPERQRDRAKTRRAALEA